MEGSPMQKEWLLYLPYEKWRRKRRREIVRLSFTNSWLMLEQ